MNKLVAFFKKETVLSIAAVLAVISMFFVHPSAAYAEYIDFRTLGILLSLMIVMEGFKRTGLFDKIGNALLVRTKRLWQLSLILVFLCFFFSMLITNDVALLTFVPFSLVVLKKCDKEKMLIPIVTLQTIAANLGSMLTPVGNPQNLYLYELMQCSMEDFLRITFPYVSVTAGLLALSIVFLHGKNEPIDITDKKSFSDNDFEDGHKADAKDKEGRCINPNIRNVVIAALFVLTLLVVLRIIPFYIALSAVIIVMLIIDYKALLTVDYALIFTFIAFFILIGNLGNIDLIRDFLISVIKGRECGIAVLASQFISNVPAAMLLSGFAGDYKSLLIGVDLGGLGTLIASMASLISYKILAHNYNSKKGQYLLFFTAVNVLYLIGLMLLNIIIK